MFESLESTLRSKIFWITATIALFYLYFKKIVYSYWRRHGVPHDKPSVPFGTLSSDLFMKKTTIGNIMKKSFENFKQYPFHGMYMFHNPVLMINDPELIKHVLVKNFACFPDRGLYINDKIDPLNSHLFFLSGDRWRKLRIKLSPSLTSGKLKHMYPFVQDIANEMINISNEYLKKSDILEIKDIVARYTTDTIFSLAFGFNSSCLRDPGNEFRHYGDLAIKNQPLRNALVMFAPNLLDYLKLPFNDPRVSTFFIKLFEDMVERRRLDKINRKDFLNMLIELIDHGQIINQEDKTTPMDEAVGIVTKLEVLEAAAQAYVFFLAGFETSSSVVTHGIYELALNPDVQEKAHAEIDEILEKSGEINYENLSRLEYLDMIFYESMRKHPSLPFLNRICVKDNQLPNSDYVVPKGMRVIISVSGLHRDPNFYPDPDKFDPTRFSKENTAARHPYAYLAFGEGPRICIGKRLGILQSKVALATLLANFKFSVCDKTPIPNYYSPEAIVQSPRDGIYLRVEKRKVNN